MFLCCYVMCILYVYQCLCVCSASDRVAGLESELVAAEKNHEDAMTAERRRHEREVEKLRSEWVNQKTLAEERINKLSAEAATAKVWL